MSGSLLEVWKLVMRKKMGMDHSIRGERKRNGRKGQCNCEREGKEELLFPFHTISWFSFLSPLLLIFRPSPMSTSHNTRDYKLKADIEADIDVPLEVKASATLATEEEMQDIHFERYPSSHPPLYWFSADLCFQNAETELMIPPLLPFLTWTTYDEFDQIKNNEFDVA
ncbi:hypothetical protein WISP_07562 [Willisornis vidua]|uniref:Uncharacterized protein n=1 Tax=Willisornis vidua TaxID=1566151 RepID=A0ABQ9DY57_9PASS|nr:hypothetical protein WISP_07562 [Willisornis vidua]